MTDTAQHSADALAKHVTRAIFALKVPSPDGSQHYQAGWDDGLEAAMDAARDALLAVLPAPVVDRAVLPPEATRMFGAAEIETRPEMDVRPLPAGALAADETVGPAADRVRAAIGQPAVPPTPDQTAEVCICGHTEQQHFEDVCITEITGCDCGDYLPPDAAHEVIDRWRQAALTAQDESPAYARLQAAAAKANADAAAHAMRGMRAVFQLARRYDGEAIPAAEVLGALGLDENANTVEAQQDPTQDGTETEEYCGAEPPSRADDPNSQWGDCWCTLPPGHEGSHTCEPCTQRHGAPGWADEPTATRSGQPETDPEARRG